MDVRVRLSRKLKNWHFWTVMLEKTLESPLEISPGCSLEGLMLKLKLQYFSHLMRRADSLEKTLMLGKIEGRRRRGRQRMRSLDGITDSMGISWICSGSWWWTGRPVMLQSLGLQRVALDRATKLNWTESLLDSYNRTLTEIQIFYLNPVYRLLHYLLMVLILMFRSLSGIPNGEKKI